MKPVRCGLIAKEDRNREGSEGDVLPFDSREHENILSRPLAHFDRQTQPGWKRTRQLRFSQHPSPSRARPPSMIKREPGTPNDIPIDIFRRRSGLDPGSAALWMTKQALL